MQISGRRITRFDTSILRGILKLLPNRTPRRLVMLVFFQIIATTFDICALLLMGILSKSGLEYVQGRTKDVELPISEVSIFSALEFERQFLLLATLIMALFTARTVLSIWGNRKILRYLGDKSATASQQIVRNFFKSKPEHVIAQKSQQILYGVTTGVDSLVLLYLGSLVMISAEAFFLVMILVTLLIIQPISGICAFTIFSISGILIHKLTSSSIKEKAEEISQLSILYNSKFLGILNIYRELLLQGKLLESTLELQEARAKHLRSRSEIMFLPIMTKYLFEFVLIFGSAIVAVVQLVLSDAITAISSIVVFLAASSRILPSTIRLQGALLTVKQSEGTGRISLVQLEEMKLTLDSNSEEYEEKESNGKLAYLEVKDVGFRFPEMSEETLRGVSLNISKGQFVAIVGESGAGKSTLADLLLGIRNPTSGSIRLNGMPPYFYVSKFPGRVSYVPQDIKIIDGDIMRNVSLSEHDQSVEDKVIDSLKRAALWEDVQQMPQGLCTQVGEHGTKLSGGQRQRLGIARALYSRPELIIFDEATSSLDPLTEKVVTDAIYNRNDKVTLLVIAHRLSTVKKADLVVLMDKGKLAAVGSFDEVRSKVPKFDQQLKLLNL